MSEASRVRPRWLGPLGWITGVTSVILGAAGVGAVLCLWDPAPLTTPALRDVYDMRLIRGLIKAGLIAGFALGAASLLLKRRKALGLTGVGIAALAMRHVVIDYLRRRYALKRDGAPAGLAPNGDANGTDSSLLDLLAIDEALTRLAALDPRQARIVELRFFGGLSTGEIATALKLSDRTVKREFQKARAFLFCALH